MYKGFRTDRVDSPSSGSKNLNGQLHSVDKRVTFPREIVLEFFHECLTKLLLYRVKESVVKVSMKYIAEWQVTSRHVHMGCSYIYYLSVP